MAAELATAAKSGSIAELVSSGVFTSISGALADAKNANGREGGLLAIAALAGSVGRPAEPYLMPLLGQVLGLLADKAAPVREAAAAAQVCADGPLLCWVQHVCAGVRVWQGEGRKGRMLVLQQGCLQREAARSKHIGRGGTSHARGPAHCVCRAPRLVCLLPVATLNHLSLLLLLAAAPAPVLSCPQKSLEELMCPHGVAAALPTLFEAMVAQKWQTNEGACKMIQVCVYWQGALGVSCTNTQRLSGQGGLCARPAMCTSSYWARHGVCCGRCLLRCAQAPDGAGTDVLPPLVLHSLCHTP